MKYYCSIFLILSYSFSQSSELIITAPRPDSEFERDDDVEIEWTYSNIYGKVILEYSIDRSTWIEINKVDVTDKNYFFELPFENKSRMNSDGSVYLRITQGLTKHFIRIIVPKIASQGQIYFTSKQNNIKSQVRIRLDGKEYSIDNKKILLRPGFHSYSAKVDGYGESSDKFNINAGRTEPVLIKIEKSWGQVYFTSEKDNNFRIYIEKKYPYKKEIQQFDAKQIIVDLERGNYTFYTVKKNYKEYRGSFTVDPNNPITIPIKLVPETANVIFITKTEYVQIFLATDYYRRGYSNTVLQLPEGKQSIVARKNGFRDTTIVVDLDPFIPLNEIAIKMVREHGSIVITSDPPGAEILIDRKPINAVTPHIIDSTDVGEHSIWVKLDKYRDESVRKIVSDGFMHNVHFPLKHKKGTLYIEKRSRNQKFGLTIDTTTKPFNTLKQNRDYVFLDLKEGLHFIQISETGYELIERNVQIKDRSEEFITAIGKPILVNIRLKSTLLNARMTLYTKDNQEYNNIDITGKKDDLKLPFGNYKIKAKAPKYEMKTVSLTVNSNGAYTIPVNLKRKTPEKALRLSVFPGAGMIYAEKQKLGIGVMAGTLVAGSYFLFSNNNYAKESSKLDDLQAEYLVQTDLEAIVASKAQRDEQKEKVENIEFQRNVSGGITTALYVLNFGLTWSFHGL